MPGPSLADPRPDRAPLPTTDPGPTGPDYSRPEGANEPPAIPGYELFEELGKGGMGGLPRAASRRRPRGGVEDEPRRGGADEHALAGSGRRT
ncbi:MAG: hypothetical protein U0797_26545 [Gemmataceae bacterium]